MFDQGNSTQNGHWYNCWVSAIRQYKTHQLLQWWLRVVQFFFGQNTFGQFSMLLSKCQCCNSTETTWPEVMLILHSVLQPRCFVPVFYKSWKQCQSKLLERQHIYLGLKKLHQTAVKISLIHNTTWYVSKCLSISNWSFQWEHHGMLR